MIKLGPGFYTFKIFSLYPKVSAFISTKEAGNFLSLKHNDFRPLFVMERFGIPRGRTVLAEQVHGAQAFWARDVHAGQIVKGADALITDQKSLFPMILVADCVPILYFDPIRNIVAVAHSGWQGALQKISLRVAEELVKTGSKKEDILIAMGPAIGGCHYDVFRSRANLFDINFGKNVVTLQSEGKFYIDLLTAAKKPLVDFGIPEKNIEIANVCTFENTGEFYSARAEGGLKGEFAAIIGMKG